MSLHSLTINQATELLAKGEINAEDYVNDCLMRINEFEPQIQAWAHLDAENALQQARNCDMQRRKGKPTGRLHGIPIGLKDIIDCYLLPSEHGCEFFKGNIAKRDAYVSEKLKSQGAIIMGKTVTAELATFTPGKTANPHNTEHTPGGSSSGSAAAVASYMIPGALGTQTNGSMIRPASFCGVVGFKPSYGYIPRYGILNQSEFLDQVGVFSRSVEDAALLAEVLIGTHPEDKACVNSITPPALLDTCLQPPPVPVKLAFVKTAAWTKADEDTQAGFEQLVELLTDRVDVIDLDKEFNHVWEYLQIVNEVEIATNYDFIYQRAKQTISESLINQIERGQQITAKNYLNAKRYRGHFNQLLNELFFTYDALLTPSAIGQAPKGLNSTGDPGFCTTWNFCGVPSINLPLLQGETGLPIGVQLIGQQYDDARLLRTAKWLTDFISELRNEK